MANLNPIMKMVKYMTFVFLLMGKKMVNIKDIMKMDKY